MRVMKIIKPRTVNGLSDQSNWKYSYYVHDATGNTMAIYNRSYEAVGANNYIERLKVDEFYLRGSERLGVYDPSSDEGLVAERSFTIVGVNSNGELIEASTSIPNSFSWTSTFLDHYVGRKRFEGVNHVGNVLVTFSDAKQAFDKNNDGIIDSYEAIVISANDYYPFGMAMPGRSAGVNYRYGFGGMEKDEEFTNSASHYDFGARIYDSRIARWLSVDPKCFAMAGYSPYVYALNNPIILVDAEGEYPKPSKLLADAGLDITPMISGLIDGFVSGLGWLDAAEFAYNLATDSEFRDQLYDTFVTIASDPVAFAEHIIADVKQTVSDIAEFNEAGQYKLGELVGEFAGGVVSGGAATKLLKYAKTFKASKISKVTSKLPCGCFTEGTEVLADTGYIEIQDIKEGDLVYAFDTINGESSLKLVTDVFKLQREAYYELYAGSEKIEVTADHPFYINGAWVQVQDLKPGDELSVFDGGKKALDSLRFVANPITVYNFTVQDYHNYYVTNAQVLVHNTGPCDLTKSPAKKVNGNSVSSPAPTQKYTIVDSKGKPYHGVGDVDGNRAKQSLERLKANNPNENFEIKSQKNYDNRAEALKAEQKGIDASGGPQGKLENGTNYNKINSPGKKL